ncbi:MAG: hypothetical protein U0V70_13980 [Terriglobia bacterium]
MTATRNSWIVVAALHREIVPLKKRFHGRLRFLETGMGGKNSQQALRALIKRESVGGVLGIGLAGALSESLNWGDLVVAREAVQTSRLTSPVSLVEAAGKVNAPDLNLRFGTVISRNEMVCTAAGKQKLAADLPADTLGCVDMESWSIAEVCTELNIPFVLVRCISDRFHENLPLDFNLYRREDGNLNELKITLSALSRLNAIGGLWQLWRHTRFCMRQLADFIDQFLIQCPTPLHEK